MVEDDEASLVALAVLLGGGGALGFFGGVEDLEGEDGEAIDDEAGCLGVERGGFVLLAGEGEEELVKLLDEVVALLVKAVDGVLDLRDAGVGGIGRAGVVLFVP